MRYILVGLLFFSITIQAENPSADAIMEKVRDFDDGRSYSATAYLRIKQKNRVRERQFYMLQKILMVKKRRDKSFTMPRLMYEGFFLNGKSQEHLDRADNQWIYFPAFRKVRRKYSNDKRGSLWALYSIILTCLK